MNGASEGLFEGETEIVRKPANAVIRLNEHGLHRLPYDQLMAMTGFAGKEAIGGVLRLTTYRLLFKSHPFNRLTGTFSIFLPTIRETRNASRFLMKKIEIETTLQTFEFVVWGVPSLMTAIDDASRALTKEQKELLARAVAAQGERQGEGLKLSPIMDKLARDPDILKHVLDIAMDPISIAGLVNAVELLHGLAGGDDPPVATVTKQPAEKEKR